jgi:hypothetical protein
MSNPTTKEAVIENIKNRLGLTEIGDKKFLYYKLNVMNRINKIDLEKNPLVAIESLENLRVKANICIQIRIDFINKQLEILKNFKVINE